ncbi:MAG TPA: SgcJ/EcaC family oxidoreductase [Thermoleophilaceae bacterium]|nr:SgcJ/EcaC family oxidoreductase [Thermoleophilaceae bacterium]
MRRRSLPGRGSIPSIDTEPHTAARDLYARLMEAWNARDADAFAALFARDGVSIGFDGSQAVGDGIREHLGAVFGDHPTAPYIAKVREVRAVRADAVLLRAIVGMVPPGRDAVNPDANALQSLLAERGEDGWRIALFQNTPAQYHGHPEAVEAHTAEIERVRAAGEKIG